MKEGTTASELTQTFMTVEQGCWSDDGRYVATSGLGRRISVKEVDQAKHFEMSKPIMTGKEEDPIRQILLSPTRSFLLVAIDHFLNIWSTQEKRVVSSRPKVILYSWVNSPSDGTKVIGFSFAGIQIIEWQEATSFRRLTLDRSLVDSTTN